MKILVVSDTHGHEKNLMTVLNRVRPVDALIHCGDVEGGEDYIRAAAECPVYMVRGNNDYFSDLPRDCAGRLPDFCDSRPYVRSLHEYGYAEGRGQKP